MRIAQGYVATAVIRTVMGANGSLQRINLPNNPLRSRTGNHYVLTGFRNPSVMYKKTLG